MRIEPETNIFFVDLNVGAFPELNVKDVVQALRAFKIVAIPWVGDSLRVVTHHDIPEVATREIAEDSAPSAFAVDLAQRRAAKDTRANAGRIFDDARRGRSIIEMDGQVDELVDRRFKRPP